MKVLFKAFFLTDEAMAMKQEGTLDYCFSVEQHTDKRDIIIEIDRVEDACKARNYPDSTSITMYSGESYVLAFPWDDYKTVIEPLNSKHIACRIHN